jgi:hypothetical protein
LTRWIVYHLDKLGETVLVKVENEIMNKVKLIADNDEGKLVRDFRLYMMQSF